MGQRGQSVYGPHDPRRTKAQETKLRILVARARDVTHWNQLRDRNVTLIQREMFESSLLSARSVLELLGHSPEVAGAIVQRFRQHNLALFEQLHPYYKDTAKMISVVKQGRLQLEEQIAKERAERQPPSV